MPPGTLLFLLGGAGCCVDRGVTDLSECTVEGLGRELEARGLKASHAARLLRLYYAGKPGPDPGDPPLPGVLVDWLRAQASGLAGPGAARRVSADGTVKLLLGLADGRRVESVLMPDFHPDRAAGCLSSQVGCAMGCDFCATARMGLERNLTAGEIVRQFLALRREARAAGRTLRTVVFMGMGEPMLNLDQVLAAIQRIADNGLGGLGWRQVTVSTVGIVPGIDALARSGLGVNLAVSLHAPDDQTRARLIPVGKRFGAAEVVDAAGRYQEHTGRPVSIQYCLLRGVNDSLDQAGQLVQLLSGRRMHVNLLSYNPTGAGLSGTAYEASSDVAAAAFMERLKTDGLVAHLRIPRGRDIEAACGQLAGRGAPASGPI